MNLRLQSEMETKKLGNVLKSVQGNVEVSVSEASFPTSVLFSFMSVSPSNSLSLPSGIKGGGELKNIAAL